MCEFHQVGISFPLVTTQLTEVKFTKKAQNWSHTSHFLYSPLVFRVCFSSEKQKSLEKVHARYSSTQIQNMSAKAESIQLFKQEHDIQLIWLQRKNVNRIKRWKAVRNQNWRPVLDTAGLNKERCFHVNSRKWLICCKVMTLPKDYALQSYLIM